MTRRSPLPRLAALALLVTTAACSDSDKNALGPTTTQPTAAATGSADATLKVTAPRPTSPVGGARVDSRRPTFAFAGATGQFEATSPGHRLEVLDANGALLDFRILAPGVMTFAADTDLAFDRTYQWRVRAELNGAAGPWSTVASFVTPTAPPAPPPVSRLPFAVPPSCGPTANPTGNRLACALDVSRVSAEWGRCAGGNAVGCHRFTRHVAAALAEGDPRWGLISKNPGEQQCTLDRCGPLGGEGLSEDAVAYLPGSDRSAWIGFDIVGGAGLPGASVQWNGPLNRRAGNNWVPVP